MKAVLLQLSDSHINSDTDTLLSRVETIAKAVGNAEYALDVCVVAFCGDVANSGDPNEYLAAIEFLGQLRNSLMHHLRSPKTVDVVVIPGNHDCNFRSPAAARDVLIKAIEGKHTPAVDASTVEVCAKVQDDFFAFRDAVDIGSRCTGSRLIYTYDIVVGKETIRFTCLNSAWLSELHERPGSLFFPVRLLNTAKDDSALSVAMLHHPYNWYMPVVGRALRKQLEATADLILTGHEHDFTLRSQRGSRGERNVYIESSALQDINDPQLSGFNAVFVDTTARKQRVINFQWSGELFQAAVDSDWEDYHVNRLRMGHTFSLQPSAREWLRDLGVSLTHPAYGPVALSDVFVYPDLREVTYRLRDVPEILPGETLSAKAVELERVLVTGAERSGKTSLAKQLFLDLLDKGFVPVYLNASGVAFGDEKQLKREVIASFERLYESGSRERYVQLDRRSRVVIVDDFHKIRSKRGDLQKGLDLLTDFAGTAILLADNVATPILEIVAASPMGHGKGKYRQYRITPYGHARRNELAEKWFALDPESAADPELYSRKLIDVKKMADTAIGKNFLPSYPVFILPLLQAQESNQQVDLAASTYGYYYELLIRSSLAKTSSREGFDVKLSYLGHLAYSMYGHGETQISEHRYREVHEEFEKRQLLTIPFAAIQAELIGSGLLEATGECFRFKYEYIYYYFIAGYIKDHLAESEIQDRVANLAKTLHQDESANVLLFLAHLSKHPFVVEQIVGAAALVFPNVPRVNLTIESLPIEKLEASLEDVVFEDKDAVDSRRHVYKTLDKIEHERARREELQGTLDETSRYLNELAVAFRTLQILGQVVKNFPGSLDGATKTRIVDECYGLGMRALGSVFRVVQDNESEFLNSVVESLRDVDPNLTDEELSRKARESIFGLMHLASYGAVKRISSAVGSPNLFRVYEALEAKYQDPASTLIKLSLELDQKKGFPEDELLKVNRSLESNHLAASILRSLVVNHFHLFEVTFSVKQRICEKLGIVYKRIQSINPARRLLNDRT